MDAPYTRKEKIVGSILIIVGIMLLITLLAIGRGKDWFQKYGTYYTEFGESYNLSSGAAVKLYNAEIGKVKNIVLVEDRVRVELKILEKYRYRIKTDSVATVKNATFFYGTEYISIKPGSTDAGFLPEGAEIPSEPKKSIEDLLSEFGIQDAVAKIIGIFKDIGDIIKQLKDPEGPLASAAHHLSRTTSHAKGITRDIDEGKGTAGQLFKSAELAQTIQVEIKNLGAIFSDLQVASERTPGMMDQVRDNLIRLEPILDEVRDSVSSLKKTLKEAETASHQIPGAVRIAEKDIREIRDALENADRILMSIQNSFLVKSNLPPDPQGERTDADLRR